MKIFNYGQFVNENQLDLFSGSGTEWDSQKGIASKVVDPQIQDQPVEIELSGTQSGTQSEVQNVVDSEKIEICAQIAKQGTFLYTDLGFQSAIQLELDKMATEIDYNPLRQDVLKILYDSGKYDRDRYRYITLTNGYYESVRLKVKQVLDKSGNYDPVNKLNTNWSDIAELIYDIIDKDDKAKELKGLNYYKMKDYLSKYFSGKELGPLLIGFDLRKYILNNRIKSSIGEEAENFVKECFDKKGMKCVFQGGDGDPVDMSYGIDLIMHNLKSGKYYLVQVKSDPVAALKASGEWRYSSLDFYCAPIIDEGVRKTILYTKENKKGVMFDNITPRYK